MTYKFEINKQKNSNYENYHTINDKLVLSYQNSKYFFIEEGQNDSVVCLGYCFDIRKPEASVNETLKKLLKSEDLKSDINFLNGHYILIYCHNDETNLFSDASSLTPVYFSKNDQEVTNNVAQEYSNHTKLNPNYSLDLDTFEVNKIVEIQSYIEQDDESLAEYFFSLIENQYKYFEDKNLDLIFQADNYHKSLFAVLAPVLNGNNIIFNKIDSKGFNKYFSKQFSKEFNMKFFDLSKETNKYSLPEGVNYLARNNLTNFNALYKKQNKKLQDEKYINIYDSSSENISILNYELNLMDLNNKSNIFYSGEYLLFEPLNARELLNIFIELNKRMTFNIHSFIINNLKPSLNYYNFTSGKTLKELNKELNQEIAATEKNKITSQNQKFLLNVKTTKFKVSQNLDGKVKHDEILVYPSHQRIKKNNEYNVKYTNSEEGMIYIEGFYKNFKNAKRITVMINDEQFNIHDFYGGRYFYFDGEVDITFKYTQDYDSLSWQKAGTLLIKKY